MKSKQTIKRIITNNLLAQKPEFLKVVEEIVQEMRKCEFESDGEKHSCIGGCDGIVENCQKCHRDICSNKDCPLGKGKKDNATDYNQALADLLAIIKEIIEELEKQKQPTKQQPNPQGF
jgi:hypothetical protein